MQNTLTDDRGQNLFTTSTGTAHHYRPGYYFPSSNYKSVLMDPIPPSLNTKTEVRPNIHFETTNNKFHDNKYPNQDVYNEALSLKQTKALPCYKVNYLNDLVEKLNSKPRRPLTMAFQKSEYKNEYEDMDSEMVYNLDRPIHRENYLFEDERADQLTKKVFDGHVPPQVPARKPIDPSQIGVFNLLDPYLTTYNKEHHKWPKEQQNGIGKKNAVTIYDTEETPKAWGFGLKQNPIPIDEVPRRNEKLPMRDEIWFKTETKQNNVHCPPKPVRHGGFTTEIRDNYQTPSDVKAKQAKLCPIDTPYIQPASSGKAIMATPNMYQSEYTQIGKGRLVPAD